MPTPNPLAAYAPTDADGMFSPARCNELVGVIAAEIVALTGCEMRFARRAASGFLNFPGDRMFGLGGAEGCGHSLTQLERWIESKTADLQVAA